MYILGTVATGTSQKGDSADIYGFSYKEFLTRLVEDKHTEFCKVGYIGDDLNDYTPMSLCGFKGCPADSCSEIKEIADYVSSVPGGHGAVRDVIEHILKERGEWDKCICEIYNAGI